MTPPKPEPRPEQVSLWTYLRLFRRDILSAQPARLYRARMAEFRTPFFRSFLINEPGLIRDVLVTRPADFPKSDRINAGLIPLLGKHSVFVTNGAEWERQRRIIDPAFEGGRLRDSFPAMRAAIADAVARMDVGEQDIEQSASRLAADIIFRTLFSVPIGDETAARVFEAFRAYQRAAPILNLAAFMPGMPAFHRRRTRRQAQKIRGLIGKLVEARMARIAAGDAPDDLCTRILTAQDPDTGDRFTRDEMVDQVAIFFLAGHETSASALGWALYLLSSNPKAQERVAQEASALPDLPAFADLSRLGYTRDVFREALRLYPPVPMMVRRASRGETFRDRAVSPGAQIVISPWHLHRHERIWASPDEFDPDRYATEEGRLSLRDGFLPFSSGRRVCVGAGFAMAEGTMALAMLVRAFEFSCDPNNPPIPQAHLTVRSANGIWLDVRRR